MRSRIDFFVGAMPGHGSWMRWFVVGTDRRAVRELPATTTTGRRARTAEFDETPHAVCRWQSRPTTGNGATATTST